MLSCARRAWTARRWNARCILLPQAGSRSAVDRRRTSSTSTSARCRLKLADLQGNVPGSEAIDAFYPDLTDPRFKASGGHLPPALFNEHVSGMAAGPALPDAGPQRRDQHAEGQRQLDEAATRSAWRPRRSGPTDQDDIKPVIQPGGSDSAALDNTFEVLVRAGRARADGQDPADPRGMERPLQMSR